MTATTDDVPETTGDPPRGDGPVAQLRAHVARVVSQLQAGYVRGDGTRPSSAAVRQLAQLRHALGTSSGADTDAWSIVLRGMPPTLAGPSAGLLSSPTRAEAAAYLAITTYAVHQQGQQRLGMHQPGATVGEATRRIAGQRARQDSPGGLDEQTVQRMHRIALAQNDAIRAQALRALVTLMRSGQPPIALDYGQLAADLFLLQTRHADSVRLRWGRGLHTQDTKPDPDADQTTSGESA